jgi:hypothetical protein
MMNEHKRGLPSLTQLTQQLREHNITLRWDIGLSHLLLVSNRQLPPDLRCTIWRYSRELFALHLLADIRVCKSPDRHRPSWYYLSSKSRIFCCQRCFEQGLDNRTPLHKARDVIRVLSREEDEVVA